MSIAGRSLYDLTFDELAAAIGSRRAEQVYRDLYGGRPQQSSVLAEVCRDSGADLGHLSQLSQVGGATTVKHLFAVAGGDAIETVRIRRHDGFTACVSSQAGCGYACRFCASGRDGLRRHLTSGEIVEQVVRLGRRVNRIVFMGIGEPLHNYDAVMRSIRILRDRRGLGFKTGGITISTIGVPRGLVRLREEHLKINLTISLHATTQEARDHLIPGARRHPIDDLVELSQSWSHRHGRVVTYVYLLLPGVNDSDDDLRRLADWFRGRPARVNLMRWNPVDGDDQFERISDRRLQEFKRGLERADVATVVRDTQGRDVTAACGQLRLHRGQAPRGQQVHLR